MMVAVPPPELPSKVAVSLVEGEPPVPPPAQVVLPPVALAHLMPPVPPPPVLVLSQLALPPTQKQVAASACQHRPSRKSEARIKRFITYSRYLHSSLRQ